VGGLTDACLWAYLSYRRAFLALLDDERLLRVRKLSSLHLIPLFSQPGKLQLQTVQFAGIRSVRNPGVKFNIIIISLFIFIIREK
jgi:hypothetical protein